MLANKENRTKVGATIAQEQSAREMRAAGARDGSLAALDNLEPEDDDETENTVDGDEELE